MLRTSCWAPTRSATHAGSGAVDVDVDVDVDVVIDVDVDVDVSVRWQPRLLEEAGGGEKGRGGVENTFSTWLLEFLIRILCREF